jgi:hypothetical protein
MTQDKLKAIFSDAFRQLTRRHTSPEIGVSFYPYTAVKHTIRLRSGRIYVRLSDIFKNAPEDVHRALAFILIARMLSKTVPGKHERIYRQYAASPQVLNAAESAGRRHGRKLLSSARGRVYDLERIFSRLNRRFFDGRLQRLTLSWSARETLGVLGHYDAAHETIVISRSLDTMDFPDWFVEYILFHEMLHIKHPARMVKGRRLYHTRAFLDEEQRFPYFGEAQDLLDAIEAHNKDERSCAA